MPWFGTGSAGLLLTALESRIEQRSQDHAAGVSARSSAIPPPANQEFWGFPIKIIKPVDHHYLDVFTQRTHRPLM